MTNAQHTPGPWIVKEQTRIEAPTYGLIANLRGEISQHYETETDANARLIAAAPDLLEALKDGLDPIPPSDAQCHIGIITQDKCCHCQRIIKKHAVIAKAT